MSNDDQIDIERELRAAMADRTTALSSPRVDLQRIRRRTATRRRLLVPVIATALALATITPFAVAQTGLLGGSTGAKVGGAVAPTAQTPGGSAEVGAGQTGGGPQVTAQGQVGTPSGSKDDGKGSGHGAGVIPGKCVSLSAPLTAVQRAALSNDAGKVIAQARGSLTTALGKLGGAGGAGEIAFSDDVLGNLLPRVGTMVDQVECAGQRHLADAQRKLMLDQVRASMLSSGLVTGVVLSRTTTWLGLGLGDLHANIASVRMSEDTMLMTVTLSGGGLLRYQNTMTVTMRLPDCAVTKLDLGNKGLAGLGIGELRSGLGGLTGGLKGIVPGVLAPGAVVSSATS